MKTFSKIACCLPLLFPLASMAQPTGQIDCRITDKDKKSVSFAAVALLNKKDSTLVKSAVTDTKGYASLPDVPDGQYLLGVNMVGFTNYISAPISMSAESKTMNLGTIELEPSSVALKEVQVVAKKPFIEAQPGKIVVNVANSAITAGSSVLDVLQKSPGVRVGNDDNISMRGKQGVMVMIDDKLTVVSGSDLSNMLRGMPAESVEKIELITNPSAKYDAAGNAGIINIKTKKDKRFGTNGSLNGSYGQGKYPKSNDGFNINNRSKSFNVFGSYNYSYRKGFSDLKLDRKFYVNDTFDGAYLQNNEFTGKYITHMGKAGADWYASPKTIAGVVVTGMDMQNITTGNNYSQVYDSEHVYTSYFTTDNLSDAHLKNYSVNGNLKTTFDSSGQQLTADIDYVHYDNTALQDFTTNYYVPSGDQYLPPYLLHGTLLGKLDIKSIKADYALPMKNKNKMEAGIKSSVVDQNNNLAFYDISNQAAVYDTTKSNHFIYTENINAAYLNYSKDAGTWTYQLGLRAEQTITTGRQLVMNSSFDNSYIELFPSAFIQKKLSEGNQLGFTATRRIDRPSYRQLNPFKFFLDPSTYSVGNPYLRPQLTWSFELTETFNQRIITTLAYSKTTDNITEVLKPSPTEDKITIQTNDNLASFDYYGLTVSVPFTITKWWESQNDINTYYGYYTGNLANTNLSTGKVNFNVNSNNTFTLPDNINAELSFNYRSREVYGYMTVEPVATVAVGLQKNAFKNKVTVKLNVNDVFYSATDAANTHFNTYDENFTVKRDTRVATLSLTYRFGNAVGTPRRKTGGADEEKNRANTAG